MGRGKPGGVGGKAVWRKPASRSGLKVVGKKFFFNSIVQALVVVVVVVVVVVAELS